MTWSYLILRVIPVIHEINALREVFWEWVGKFLLKSIIALYFAHQSWPKAWSHGFWFFGHLDAKNSFLAKFWCSELFARSCSKPHQINFFWMLPNSRILQEMGRALWEYHNPGVKRFGHDGWNKSELQVGLYHFSDSNPYSGVELNSWTFQWDLTL